MLICCRKDSPDTDVAEDKAGKYGYANSGDYSKNACDLPNVTAESFVQEAVRMNPDAIFWLGDNPPHNIENQSAETQMGYFRFIKRLFNKYGYAKKVYMIMGNHESYPLSQFDTVHGKHQWLLDSLASDLSEWYTPEATESMRRYGYFAQILPGTSLKVIGLNGYLMDPYNTYIWGNATDPFGFVIICERKIDIDIVDGTRTERE